MSRKVMSAAPLAVRLELEATGQVQGVGFRPYVFRLAGEIGVSGWIVNDGRGVRIQVQGSPRAVEQFRDRLPRGLPVLASIATLHCRTIPLCDGERQFEIRASELSPARAQVAVDTAVCEDCLGEMRTPSDRRHRYAFINCTNCGPRYSIIQNVPYDRPGTTMSGFAMCSLCASQYGNPTDRRFHAQPIACPRCGPGVWLADAQGTRVQCDDAIASCAALLAQGQIVAIKGLGGFHIACRADSQEAVLRLRLRKRRDSKPLAVMVGDLASAQRLCVMSPEAQRLLAGPRRPIVVMAARHGNGIADAVANGLTSLGVMLPYTPLHHLLLEAMGPVAPPLVMTSGNLSDEPLLYDNEQALAGLGGLADAFVLHDRPIERPVDDSVAQLRHDGQVSLLRRARGYAPEPIRLQWLGSDASVLAVGGELKSAVCLLRDGEAVLGEHVGDLKAGKTYRRFGQTIADLEKLFEFEPTILATDLHPQYLSTSYAARRARAQGIELVAVQHHHAHIAACMAENGVAGPVIGLACDGTGYGDDGAIWGGEVMVASLKGYERVGHLRYLSLVGGDGAARETWRPALAALVDALGIDEAARVATMLKLTAPEALSAGLEMLASGAACVRSSSMGRWFDAVAALTGLATANGFEGEAPMRLEAACSQDHASAYGFELTPGRPAEIDLRPMVRAIVADLAQGVPAGVVAARFHNTLADGLAAGAARVREQTGLATVALSGGCFANQYLSRRLEASLRQAGFEVLVHRLVPPNDGGLALGQAIVAAARHRRNCGVALD